MPQPNELSRSRAALDRESTLIAVVAMSQTRRRGAGVVPAIDRQPLENLAAQEAGLLQQRHRWGDVAIKAGRTISRIAVAYQAGRDGFWRARRLRAKAIDA